VTEAPHKHGSAAPLVEALSDGVLDALEALQFPAALVDLQRRVQWQNAAAIALVGDIRGRLDSSVVAPADLEAARTQFARKVLGAPHTEHLVTVVCADGSYAQVETSSVPIHGPGGLVGVLAVGRVADRERGPASGGATHLTPRERQTLSLLAAGCSTRQMAKLMGITPHTVRNHVKSLCRRLGATSRVEAVAKGKLERLL
jgi:DNA-binding CsgD family transcriptional regulator